MLSFVLSHARYQVWTFVATHLSVKSEPHLPVLQLVTITLLAGYVLMHEET